MAEAFVNQMSDQFEAESAGIEPGRLNLFVVKAMAEIGIDISQNSTNSVQSFIDEGRRYDYIVTVCDEASAERCPLFPGKGQRVHMGFLDPSAFEGSDEEKFQRTCEVRDAIKEKITQWLAQVEHSRQNGQAA